MFITTTKQVFQHASALSAFRVFQEDVASQKRGKRRARKHVSCHDRPPRRPVSPGGISVDIFQDIERALIVGLICDLLDKVAVDNVRFPVDDDQIGRAHV